MPLDVFVPIFGSSDDQDDNEREDDKTWRDGGEYGEELENCYGEEKAVEIWALVVCRVSAETESEGKGSFKAVALQQESRYASRYR